MNSLTLVWHDDRAQGLSWKESDALADPTQSSLWPHYREAAGVTAPNNWTLPGAPCGGSMDNMTIPRLVQPMVYYEKGLEMFEQLPAPTASDALVACAMRLARGMLAVEMAAEGLQYEYQPAYDLLCDVMGPATRDVVKPFELVTRWMGGVGILGVANERWTEVKAVLVLLAQLPQDEEMEGFAHVLKQRAVNAMDDPGPWLKALGEQMGDGGR